METALKHSEIAMDVWKGLSSGPKYLLPKYFYDDIGSRIFQEIMNMPEYYLTDCEDEILRTNKNEICHAFMNSNEQFDLIELGSGDGAKTKIILKHLVEINAKFTYLPIDICAQANDDLVDTLEWEIPDLNVKAYTGDYFQVLEDMNRFNRKVILLLGSNIGNFSEEESNAFLTQLANLTESGDLVLIGFDLKKSPQIILQAYDDPHGYTRRFNLNLLHRLNRELSADFNLDVFLHHATYNPVSGDAESYLVSTINQIVYVNALDETFRFRQWEPIFMERSHKYDMDEIQRLAAFNGFEIRQNFFDRRNYFTDSLWIRK